MARIAYYRVSSKDQSTDSQRHAMSCGEPFDREFMEEGISGATMAAQRPQFGKLLEFIRAGDSLHVYAVDRLGRDAIDVQSTVRALLLKGVAVNVHGLGVISKGVGELILAVLAQVANMEKDRINERTASGRKLAAESLKTTGKTHHGKLSMGRPKEGDPAAVKAWRIANSASIAKTSEEFKLSAATVKRYCAA